MNAPNPRKRPFTVALTGGVASGKSEVARRFAALGVPIVDADVVARELVAPGSPALAEIVGAFGPGAIDASGALDRARMRQRIFDDPAARERLNAILHPRVRAALGERSALVRGAYVLIVVPLLAESGAYDFVDRALVVDAPRALQHQRLVARDGIAPALADAMLDAQATREQRLAIAHDVIVNDGMPDDLDAAVRTLHERYLAMAA